MADMFLSYAHEDRAIAQRLVLALRDVFKSANIFWDDDLRSGDAWRDRLDQLLKQAKCVLVLWSRTSITKPFVREEASRANSSGLLIQVLVEDGVEVPLGFAEIQHQDLASWCRSTGPHSDAASRDDQLSRLVEALSKKLSAQKRALLIGVGSHQNKAFLPPLQSPASSIEELKRVLGSDGAGFEVSLLQNPSRQQIAIALEKLLKQARAEDVVLLYFTGHGKIGVDGRLYLCAADTDPEALDATSVSLNWLARRTIDKTQSNRVVILLDCRYGLADPKSGNYEVANVLQAELGPGHGKYLITSATALELELDPPDRGYSDCVKWISYGLTTFEADRSKDGVITVDELYEFLEERLSADRHGAKPMKWAFDVSAGQVELVRKRGGAAQIPPLPPKNRAFYAAVKAAIEEGRSVPLVGDGIYSNAALGSFQLIRAVIQQAGGVGLKLDERYPLATAAEYLSMSLGERSTFLGQFREILESQEKEAKAVATHAFIRSRLPTPWVVVSATYDWVLERELQDAGLPFTVLAHVLDAEDELLRGRILVFRNLPGRNAEVMHADQFTLRDEPEASQRVIYKLVGSPFLHDYLPGVDTVVITETDHIRFLAGLRTRETTIPEQLQSLFRAKSLLFLGYNLDVWHYRLIGYIFSKNGLIPPTKRRYAVRTATSNIEELFWTQVVETEWRLQSDCDDFVRTAEAMVHAR